MLLESLFYHFKTRMRSAGRKPIRSDIAEETSMSTMGAKIVPIVTACVRRVIQNYVCHPQDMLFRASAPA